MLSCQMATYLYSSLIAPLQKKKKKKIIIIIVKLKKNCPIWNNFILFEICILKEKTIKL
ncbi:hypothetical protein [Plasmodium yoelii yoelii]|uniref:Uncharacterized protein n=1 Tax=Plasmodium yoelii yoelii TaxID=73239 RepID=Q7RC33_PLAYO|nr:hypothetical protein [Plasmodium yoelii yoelii]